MADVRLGPAGHDRIKVLNNPVNWIDPWGLVSAGQLGIGNPGSYGGTNTCESMYDEKGPWYARDRITFEYMDFSDVPITLGEIPIGPGNIFKGLDATKKVQDLLKGTGQIPALLRNKNLRGVDTQGLLDKTLKEVKELLTKKQFKTFMKHFEGRNLRHGQ